MYTSADVRGVRGIGQRMRRDDLSDCNALFPNQMLGQQVVVKTYKKTEYLDIFKQS